VKPLAQNKTKPNESNAGASLYQSNSITKKPQIKFDKICIIAKVPGSGPRIEGCLSAESWLVWIGQDSQRA
jgi:hypothetical protein